MKCKICKTEIKKCFSEMIMHKYDIDYFHCLNCDFVQTEEPYWLDESYLLPINLTDTGYMTRNLFYSKRLTILLYLLFGKNGRYLDYAAGYGIFVRLMRDIGFDFFWNDKYTQNLFSSGFEWDQNSDIDAITLFEVFEHFVDPINEIKNLLINSDTLIFTTVLHPNPLPKPKDWWYYGLDHGQHIVFYSRKTFELIAKKFDLNYYSITPSFHILSRKNIAPYKLKITRLSKIGLHKIIYKFLQSKTESDYNLMTKNSL